jgi:hypothetical protein
VIIPVITVFRARNSRSLDDEQSEAPNDAPLVSAIIPARNEARNIARCARSALASAYPHLEVLVVDDHSTDGTGHIAREIAAADARLRVIVPAPLPDGWFGKQWACATGAASARGEVLAFFDADTTQSPDLIPRAINAMQSRTAEMLSIAGAQELGSFWERVIQPQVFGVMLLHFGGTETVNSARRPEQKIANGQCIFIRGTTYREMGGHGAVRDRPAEDLALAQLYFVAGRSTAFVLGLRQLSTRMYTSLRELIDGWGKNLYSAGRTAMPLGSAGRAIYPLVLLSPALFGLAPCAVLILWVAGALGTAALVWSVTAFAASTVWWALVYGWLGLSPLYGLLHPVGSLAFLYICARSIARGRRVEWKGREYIVR